MHKYINNALPEALSDIFTRTHSVHEHLTRQHDSLRPPACRLAITLNSILCKGPSIWNSLPSTLQNKHHQSVFIKKTLKYALRREHTLM